MTETQLKNKVIRYLRTVDRLWFYKTADKFTSGIPDIIGCYDGKFFAIELKQKGKYPTRLQENVLENINRSGGYTCVAISLEEVKYFIFDIEIE